MSDELNSRLKNIETMLQLILRGKVEMTEDEVGVNEAAEICGLSVGSIYNYVSCGKMNIPYDKRGVKLSFKREDVVRWNADRCFRVTSRINETTS